ncbi:MAG TPA: hypothetical protein VG815_01880 [Chloroflexota bacterium]|nr:hypothetical protein [Chloroflexota bacterium]
MMDTTENINTVAHDSTVSLVDGIHVFQSQAVQLGEAWLKAVSESQKVSRDLTKSLVKQAFTAQNLWQGYAKDSFAEFNNPLSPKASVKPAAK